jgi:two-component system OmpR family sensor kinase
MVVAPLTHRGVVVGALKALSSAPNGFAVHDVENLELMAGFIAAALSQARRFEVRGAEIRELLRLNQALDGFSAHVAHDLKNPLAVVTMASESLREEVVDLPAEAAELLAMIERHAARSGALIDGLLSLARASRTPRQEAFDLGAVVASGSEGIAGITLENRCHGVTVVADRLATQQAVANLLSNAGRYAPGAVAVECEQTAEGWRVLVSDRGPGLAPEDRDRVFAAFERGRRAAAGSSGLGLAIVAAMAEAHGGRAGCEPRPGGGSVFWFSLLRAAPD